MSSSPSAAGLDLFSDKYDWQLPKLGDHELNCRLHRMVPFAIFPQDECWVIKKPTDLRDAYMWTKDKTGQFMGTFLGDRHITRDNNPAFTIRVFITLHRFAYHGFFKPDLIEVASQLPQALFCDYTGDEIYVTTLPASDDGDPAHVMSPCDRLHVGRTLVAIPFEATNGL